MTYGPPILVLVAVILLVIAAFGGAVPYVSIGWLGLAFLAASFLPPLLHGVVLR